MEGIAVTNLQIKDLKIEEIFPINIDGVLVDVKDNIREVGLPITMTGEQFGRWKAKGRGGVFYKDLFNWINGKEHGKYVHIEGEYTEDEKKIGIFRLIEDEELEDFEAKKLVNGKLVDKFYMELIDLSEFSDNKDGYIEENQEDDITLDQSMNLNPNNIPPEEDEANSGRSISLFD